MLYNNLLYFLVAIFVFSTNTPAAKPALPLLWALAAFAAAAWGFAYIAHRLFSRAQPVPPPILLRKKSCRSLRCWCSWGLSTCLT